MRIPSCILFILLLGGLFAACDSNPVDDEHEEHFEPVRAELVLNGAVIVDVSADNANDSVVRDTIEVSVGYATALIRTRFFDEDGDEIDPEGEDEFSLNIGTEDESVAEVEQHEGEEWEFHIVGENVGGTELLFAVNHRDHVDFGTFRIPVSIVESGGRHDGEEHAHDDDDE